MLRITILSALMVIASLSPASSIELLANIKLWKSVSPQLLYDFSGNSRHSRLTSRFIVTDRGLASNYQNSFIHIGLMSYGFLYLEEYTISVWILNFGGLNYMFLLADHGADTPFKILYKFDSNVSYTTLAFYKLGVSNSSYNYTPKIEGWNLHTIRIYKTTSNSDILYTDLYLNLIYIRSSSISSGMASFIITGISLYYQSDTGIIIINEVWVHSGFSNISDLNHLIFDSSSCGCEYKCPTTPNQTCLQPYGKFYNKSGQLCDTSCTDISQSCDTVPTNCILLSKPECPYGLYDRESLECIFYCPYNSCTCPSLVSSPVNTLLSCSCIAGFKKISDDLQACISNRCLEYHRVDYNYVCDTTESGYSLDNTGRCCICASGSTQVQSNPIICVNTSICIGHSILGNDYICSNCVEGYAIDGEGKCNLCSAGYVNVLANPYTCILKIDNCIEYIYIDTVWNCIKCNEGYFLYEISINNPICAQVINSCADYILGGNSPICHSCEAGFYLSESKNECLILNCLSYIIDEYNHNCSQCSIGYEIDSNGKCNQCSDHYERVSEDPYECIPKLEHCSSYQILEGRYICQECKEGYQLGFSGVCDGCEDGFVLIESERLECKAGIPNCLNYEIYEQNLRCLTCKEGYALDLNYECTLCDRKYMHHPQDASICIIKLFHCLEYELYQDTMICKKCETGYDLDDNFECTFCAQGYISSNNSTSECIINFETPSQDSDSEFTDDKEEALSEVEIQRGEVVESSNSIAATATLASVGVSSMISLDPNTIILYLNTIQILSLIQYLNINLPFEVRQQQSSTNQHIKKINILSYISIHGKDSNEALKSYLHDESSFIANTIYQFMILISILMINLLIYCLIKCFKGKLKELVTKILGYFHYDIYIQLYMITYLDMIFNAISKLMHVISI